MSSQPSSPRREFLGQLTAAAAVALVGTACASAPAASNAAPAPTPAGGATGAPRPTASRMAFDDTWTSRLTAKHRGVFDCPEIGEGLAIFQARIWMSGMKTVLGDDATAQAVLVLRHDAVPMVLDDEMWAKYELGKANRTKDQKTKRFATANPFRAALEKFTTEGSIVLGCNLALSGCASQLASATKGDAEEIGRELRAHLIRGALLMPSGVYAVHRAQEAGCTYIRST